MCLAAAILFAQDINGLVVPPRNAPALACKARVGRANGSSGVVTVRKNGSPTTITCTFGTGTTCRDTSYTSALSQFDTIGIIMTTQNAETLADIGCTVF